MSGAGARSEEEVDPAVQRALDRLDAYEERSAGVMIGFALGFLVFYAMDVLWLSMPDGIRLVVAVAQYLIWAVFVADFAYRVWLSPNRWLYVAKHPMDLATLLLPMLRPLRALRLFAAARVLIDRGYYVAYGRLPLAIGGTALFIILVGALTVLDFERYAPGANITTLGDSLWWAGVTITTVGYGDYYPVTLGGRAAALTLMAVGISLLGAVTASFASWFTQRVQGQEDDALEALTSEIAELRREIGERG